MTKYLVIIILFIGILLIAISLTQSTQKCPPEKIIYRYLPRTFEEEQDEPVYVSDIFNTMFTQESPWVKSINSYDARKAESVNKYFISQY
jgi:hypothetical protein